MSIRSLVGRLAAARRRLALAPIRAGRLDLKLTVGLVAALLAVGLPFFARFYIFHHRQLIEELRAATGSIGRLVSGSIEAEMLIGSPHRIQELIERLSRQAGVERIILLNRSGEVRFSSDRQALGQRLDRRHDPACVACHGLDPSRRQTATVVQRGPASEAFRAMAVIGNRPACHRCHGATEPITSVLVVDMSVAPVHRQLAASMKQMLVMAASMGTLTVVVLVLLIRGLVLKRLGRLARATELVRRGELGTRIPVDSTDEIGRLADGFNAMSESLGGSLGELQRQGQFLENLIDSIRDEIVVFDRTGSAVTANRAGRERRFGGGAATCRPLTLATFATGQPARTVELDRSADGVERHLEIHTYPLRDAGGEVSQVIQVARDVSEREHLEAHLMHSERLASLGLLASGLCHEINNPLGTIGAAIDGLLRKVERSPAPEGHFADLGTYLRLVRQEVQRARGVTDRLLILSRPPGMASSLIDVCRSVADTVALVRFQADQAGVAVVESLDPASPLVKGDESSLRQVVLNLLLNALQAMDGAGEIRVETGPAGPGVVIVVRDTGRGIAPEHRERVFEPFFTTRTGQRGTGLGLFIAASIVEQMGGRIEVDSQLGGGSEFRVFLPAA